MAESLVPATQNQDFNLADIMGEAQRQRYIREKADQERVKTEQMEALRRAASRFYGAGKSALDPRGFQELAATDLDTANQAAASEASRQENAAKSRQELEKIGEEQSRNLIGMRDMALQSGKSSEQANAIMRQGWDHYLEYNKRQGIVPRDMNPVFDPNMIELGAKMGAAHVLSAMAAQQQGAETTAQYQAAEPFKQAAAQRETGLQLMRDAASEKRQYRLADYNNNAQLRRDEYAAQREDARSQSDWDRKMHLAALENQQKQQYELKPKFDAAQGTEYTPGLNGAPGSVRKIAPSQEEAKNAQQAQSALGLLDAGIVVQGKRLSVEDAIKNSTGSWAGSSLDTLRGVLGGTSTGGEIISALEPLAGRIVSMMPRAPGDQSNAELQQAQQMAARISDPTVPVDKKLAAYTTLRGMLQQYIQGPPRSTLNRFQQISDPRARLRAIHDAMPDASDAEILRVFRESGQ